jgi:hypothetical protein
MHSRFCGLILDVWRPAGGAGRRRDRGHSELSLDAVLQRIVEAAAELTGASTQRSA